ncbi:hypothetical protein GQ53DRAFT_714837 [Thozetella sp. PMI_491]|nr:hypothetical protein GQ53DRAFT_714837 [Thozetella sp. PMI_491]
MEHVRDNPRNQKACDACKSRKVRCSGAPGPCLTCVRRKETCRFSRPKLPRRQKVDTGLINLSSPPPSPKVKKQKGVAPARVQRPPASPPLDTSVHLPELYVDRLLAKRRMGSEQVGDGRQFPWLKGTGLFIGNYRLSFFSENRLQSLSTRLHNNKVDELVQKISVIIRGRMLKEGDVPTMESQPRTYFEDQAVAQGWISLYFERVHPLYPFLDRESFEIATKSPSLPEQLRRDKAWCALYHSVLALGCQFDGGGSFEPGKGQAWKLFRVSMALYQDLLGLPHSLSILQAMTAMTVYASGIACLSIEHVVMSEAVRRAQGLATTVLPDSAQQTYHKTFWVLYSMEKLASFCFGRTSSFVDYDISCPIPVVPEAVFNDFDWFLALAQHARLLSRALTSVFSVGVSGSSGAYYLAVIERLGDELEQWRLSIPVQLRPREPFRAAVLPQSAKTAALWTHYLYHSFRLSLARVALHLDPNQDGLVSSSRQSEIKAIIMETSRSILELSIYIDVEPYSPIWMIAGIPIMALFVLFDLVIHNPRHTETGNNLALLDMAGGHFSRIQYASNGTLPGSLITDFAYIAREYANNFQRLEAEASSKGSTEFPPAPLAGATKTSSTPYLAPTAQPGLSTNLTAPRADPGIVPVQTQCSNTPSDGDSSTRAESLSFPATDGLYDIAGSEDILAGTDVMDLFNYFIPGIEPVFWLGSADSNNV